eukprot:scaffold1088_cov247-Pinguiococcus_pyrenoidosus.AAC.7
MKSRWVQTLRSCEGREQRSGCHAEEGEATESDAGPRRVVVDGVPGASATAEYGIGIINEDATVAWLLAETLRRHRENFNESPQALGLRRLVPPGPNGLVAAGKMDGEMQEYGVDVPALALLTDVAYPGARFLTLPYDVRPSMQGRGQSFKVNQPRRLEVAAARHHGLWTLSVFLIC